jgi:hypothetical protein
VEEEMNEKLSTVYTGTITKVKFVSQSHVEAARRVLKPDGDYKKSNESAMDAIKSTSEVLSIEEGFKKENEIITIAFTSEMVGNHIIQHTVENTCGTSVIINESV